MPDLMNPGVKKPAIKGRILILLRVVDFDHQEKAGPLSSSQGQGEICLASEDLLNYLFILLCMVIYFMAINEKNVEIMARLWRQRTQTFTTKCLDYFTWKSA